jgi:hypothetical protein
VRGYRKIKNNELHNPCPWPDIKRRVKGRRIGGEEPVARIGEMRNAYRILVAKN